MSVQKIEGIIEALSPIVHHGDEKTGSTPILRSLTHWDAGRNEHVRLPFISGNAIRGILRRKLMRDMLDRAGYENQSTKIHHALFTGGLLEQTKETSTKLDMDLRATLRDNLPPVALLGTAVGNQIVSGCLRVGHAMPICSEYAACIPDIDDPRKQHDVRTFTDVSFATRRDDLRADREEDEQAHQMKIEFEAFIAGTGFSHQFVLSYANAVESACLGHAMDLLAEEPYIGGKSSSGYGHIAWRYNGMPDGAAYVAWLAEHGDAVCETIGRLSAMLDGGKFDAPEV
ncbi:MAG: hypothetical protein WC977_04420 [Anaerovoracaceae bacterium]|jgi:hypothetical protein